MRTLAIDTSGLACSIALFEKDQLIADRHEALGRGHAERLIPWIAALPDGGRAQRIIAGCGPGSFTGVRIGLAAAKALGLGWNARVVGVSSMALVAAGAGAAAVTVALEAGHGEIFVQNFEKLVPAADARSIPPEAAARAATHHMIIGSGAERLVALRGWGEARAGEARAADALKVGGFGPAVPIYGRGADARPMAA